MDDTTMPTPGQEPADEEALEAIAQADPAEAPAAVEALADRLQRELDAVDGADPTREGGT